MRREVLLPPLSCLVLRQEIKAELYVMFTYEWLDAHVSLLREELREAVRLTVVPGLLAAACDRLEDSLIDAMDDVYAVRNLCSARVQGQDSLKTQVES